MYVPNGIIHHIQHRRQHSLLTTKILYKKVHLPEVEVEGDQGRLSYSVHREGGETMESKCFFLVKFIIYNSHYNDSFCDHLSTEQYA